MLLGRLVCSSSGGVQKHAIARWHQHQRALGFNSSGTASGRALPASGASGNGKVCPTCLAQIPEIFILFIYPSLALADSWLKVCSDPGDSACR